MNMIVTVIQYSCFCQSRQGAPFSLKQVTVPVVSDEQCSQPDWYGTSFYIPPEQFCAGFAEGGMDACDVSVLGRVHIANITCRGKKLVNRVFLIYL